MKKLICEPTRSNGIFVPPPQRQLKARTFIQGYYKGYGSNTHERQYVLEVCVLSEREEKNCVCNEYIGCAMRQRDRHGKDEGKAQQMEIRGGGKANSLTTVNKDSMVMIYEDCVLCEKTEGRD